MKASFSWSTRREGNSGFIRETRPDGTTHDFGPMPTHLVMPFVWARRTLTRHMMLNSGAIPIPEADNYNYLEDPPA